MEAGATVVTLIHVAIRIPVKTPWAKRQTLETLIDSVVAWRSRFNEKPKARDIYPGGLKEFRSFDDVKKLKYDYIMF